MAELVDRRILLGVTGGIAAYKSAELVRALTAAGAQVRVVMTPAACAFIGPITLQALSGERVRTDLLDAEAEQAMGHIELARWAELVLIAPATAETLADLAQGRADNLLNTICLATEAPLAVAPAMNRVMWAHPATQTNLHTLTDRGVHVLGPEAGDQACGETGAGRMREPDELVGDMTEILVPPRLSGQHVLITAGPTQEPLDPVRYIGNYSTGRMGFAIAAAAARAGARVTLVAGPVSLPTPAGVTRIDVQTADEMLAAVEAAVNDAQLFIATAAVADFRPRELANDKIKKSSTTSGMTVELIRNPDILAQVARRPNAPFTIGFAAETANVMDSARDKRATKGIDMICANRVGNGSGFGAVESTLDVLWAGGERTLGPASKPALARQLIDLVTAQLSSQTSHIGLAQ